MKTIVFLLCLFAPNFAFAQYVLLSPSSNQTVQASSSGLTSLSVLGVSGSEPGLSVQNNYDWDAIDAQSADGVALYGYSQTFIGVWGTSASGNSGYFQSTNAENVYPTLVVQDQGNSNAFLMEFQDSTGSANLDIDNNGVIYVYRGLRLDTFGATQPACSSSNRGDLWVIQGGSGVADQPQICIKNSSDAYVWINL